MATSGDFSTVLITGGTDGLGKAAAIRLAQHGYRVFATGRNAARRNELATLAAERKLPLETMEMDVCDDGSVERGVKEIYSRAGSIDVLINNAGLGYYAVLEELTIDDVRAQFETNVFAVLRVTQKVLPGMRAAGRGRIINISSVAGRVALPLSGAYCGSKFALEAMSDSLRMELNPFGIDVVLIEPGYIPTGFQDVAKGTSMHYHKNPSSPYAKIYAGYDEARKKMGFKPKYTPEDFADVALKAVSAKHPRTRYGVTHQAKLAAVARRLMTDRMLDRRMIKTFGLKRES